MSAPVRRFRSIALALGLIAAVIASAPGAGALPDPGVATVRPATLQKQIADLAGTRAVIRWDPALVSRPAFVNALGGLGLAGRYTTVLPMALVEGPTPLLRDAARLPGVVSIHPDERIHFDLHESVPLVYEGPTNLKKHRDGGFDGRGVNIAVVDSGVNGLHQDLKRRIVHNVKFAGTAVVRTPLVPTTPVVCPANCNSDTTSGHGTHVAGTVVGDGTASKGFYTGVAPGAGLVALGVGDGNSMFYAIEAFDYLLAHPELNVVAVNNSWGRSQDDGLGRFDSTHPVNVASKALHDAGVAVVFTTGNTSTGDRVGDQAGGSTCDTVEVAGGGREAGPGVCRFSVYGSAPWTISVAAGRKDRTGFGPGQQYLAVFSSRGDPVEQTSLDGVPVSYLPTLTAPGVNIRAARNLASEMTAVSCGSAEAPACVPPKGKFEPYYVPSSGTSMAAPHVTGAVAVIQSAAKRYLKRLLTPDEVKSVLVASAAPMTEPDGMWDFPCGTEVTIDCGTNQHTDDRWTNLSGTAYQPYQVGAGYLNVAAAIRVVRDLWLNPPAPEAPPEEGAGEEPSPEPSPTETPGEEPSPEPSPTTSPDGDPEPSPSPTDG